MSDTTFGKHYSLTELMEIWGWSYETLRRRFANEPGVLKRPYRIPEAVARRVHLKYTNK